MMLFWCHLLQQRMPLCKTMALALMVHKTVTKLTEIWNFLSVCWGVIYFPGATSYEDSGVCVEKHHNIDNIRGTPQKNMRVFLDLWTFV